MREYRELRRSNDGEKNGSKPKVQKCVFIHLCICVSINFSLSQDLTSVFYNKLYNRWQVERCECVFATRVFVHICMCMHMYKILVFLIVAFKHK